MQTSRQSAPSLSTVTSDFVGLTSPGGQRLTLPTTGDQEAGLPLAPGPVVGADLVVLETDSDLAQRGRSSAACVGRRGHS